MQVQEEAVPAWDANHQIKHRLSKNRHLQEESKKKHSTRKENHQKTLRKTTKTDPSHSQNPKPISGPHPLAAAPEHQGPRARNGSGAPDLLAAAAARAPGNLQEGEITCGTTDV